MKTLKNLATADHGSYYTIIGAGGDVQEWVNGYEKLLQEKEVGKPVVWYKTNGAAFNDYAQPVNPDDAFQDDLTILMFPLDGMNINRLAIFKLQMEDRWFDDIVANIPSAVRA